MAVLFAVVMGSPHQYGNRAGGGAGHAGGQGRELGTSGRGSIGQIGSPSGVAQGSSRQRNSGLRGNAGTARSQ